MIIISIICAFVIIKLIALMTNARCKSRTCLVGKTAIITGGNSGIGLETARHLAARGCRVIIADKDDSAVNVSKIIKETNNPNVVGEILNLESFHSVREFALEIKKSEKRLDILINNAGIGDNREYRTKDGIQKIMQVNYFGHFLLTQLLAELLIKSAPSRIIHTSSALAYFYANLRIETLTCEFKKGLFNSLAGWSPAYGSSKVAVAIASKMLSEKLKSVGVTSNCFHPGVVRTNIYKKFMQDTNTGWFNFPGFLYLISYIFGKSVEEGSQTMLHLATSNDVEKTTGEYFIELYKVRQPRQVYEKEFCQKIWELSEDVVGLSEKEKLDILIKNKIEE